MTQKQQQHGGVKAFVKDFLLGGTAAGISKTIASPIEVIKMRL